VTTVLRHNVDVLVNQTASAGKCADSFTLPTPINISHLQDIVSTPRRATHSTPKQLGRRIKGGGAMV